MIDVDDFIAAAPPAAPEPVAEPVAEEPRVEVVPFGSPAVEKTVRVRGLRIEVQVFDEGVEWPSREAYVPDFPAPYLRQVKEIEASAMGAARALAGSAVVEFFAARPVEVDLPRSQQEIRFERLREGRALFSDLFMEDAKLNPQGKVVYAGGGGYGRAPWDQSSGRW